MRYEVISRPKAGLVFPKVISLDTEYSEKNIRKARLLSISIGVSEDLTYILEDFRVVSKFVSEADIIFTWNGVVDHYMLSCNGFQIERSKIFDAMLAEHLLDERLDHGLGDFALREFNDDYKSEFWGKYDRYQDAPKDEAYDYEMRDGCFTYIAGRRYQEALKDRWPLVEHVHRLQWALFETETRGIRVNKDLMIKTKEEMGQRIAQYLPKLREEFDEYCKVWELQKYLEKLKSLSSDRGRNNAQRPVFSFSSDAQLSWLLYQGLGIEATEKTKKGNPSTSYETLTTLAEHHPRIKPIVDYKETKAVYATFIIGLLERVEEERLHPHFNPNGTPTGRLSSSNPNFQNMPQEGVIRNFILPDDGCLIAGADFRSLEVAVEANLTGDKALLSIMLEGVSKHDLTAEAVGMSRKDAKTLNFLCQYGGGIWKIQKTFGVSEKEAQGIFDLYWNKYSGVRDYKSKVFKELADTGKVVNCFGRTRHFPKPKNGYEKAKFERQAYSHMIQGPGAEMTNISTYLVKEHFEKEKLGRFLFPVHDELVVSAVKNRIEEAKEAVVKIMESTSDMMGFKYKIEAAAYGGFEFWQKA